MRTKLRSANSTCPLHVWYGPLCYNSWKGPSTEKWNECELDLYNLRPSLTAWWAYFHFDRWRIEPAHYGLWFLTYGYKSTAKSATRKMGINMKDYNCCWKMIKNVLCNKWKWKWSWADQHTPALWSDGRVINKKVGAELASFWCMMYVEIFHLKKTLHKIGITSTCLNVRAIEM